MLVNRNRLVFILSMICLCFFSSFTFASTPVPVLRANFDGNLDAVTANGTIVKPLQNEYLPNTFPQGVVGQGVEFEDKSNWIRYSKVKLPSEDFTLIFWYKDTGAGTYSANTALKQITLWTASQNYIQMEFRYTPTKQPYMWITTFVKGGTTKRSIYLRDEKVEYKIPDYAPNVWHCIGLTFDYSESLATFYMDGVPVSTIKIDNFNLAPSANSYVMIGHSNGNSIKAIFDEMAIYDTAFTAEEMQSYYRTTKGI